MCMCVCVWITLTKFGRGYYDPGYFLSHPFYYPLCIQSVGLFIEGRSDDTHTLDVRMYLIVLPRTHANTHTIRYIHSRVYTHTLLYAYTSAYIPLYSDTHLSIYTHTRTHTIILTRVPLTSHILTFINIQILKCHIYTLKYGHKTQIPIPTHTAYTND